jgi:hypothetical protein
MIFPGWFPDGLMVIGVVMAWVATILYARSGRAALHRPGESDQPSSGG